MMLLSQEIEVEMEPEPEEPVIKEVPMENVRFLEARKERNGKIIDKKFKALHIEDGDPMSMYTVVCRRPTPHWSCFVPPSGHPLTTRTVRPVLTFCVCLAPCFDRSNLARTRTRDARQDRAPQRRT